MMRSVIGIACGHQWETPERFYVNASYVRAILQAGGTPLIIPYMDDARLEQVVAGINGLLVPGGIDVDPASFGETPHPKCGEINPFLDEMDRAIISKALAHDLPILAICRGVQVLNIVAGGTLIQDIPSQVPGAMKHQQQAPNWHPTHEISIESGSTIARVLGTTKTRVNSYHHQAVGKVASGFQVSARSADGVIEAIESKEHPYVVGVQWHPELMINHYPLFKGLFDGLIAQTRN